MEPADHEASPAGDPPSDADLAHDTAADVGYAIEGEHLVVLRRGAASRRFLGDPSDPVFLRLPRGIRGGRELRRRAFSVWARHVREHVRAGRIFETTYRPARPIVTALTVLGAASVTALCCGLLLTWASRPEPAVAVRPTTSESFAIVLAVGVVVTIVVLVLAALVRAVRCRRGSYADISARGLRTVKGRPPEPFDVVSATDHHALLRCTRIAFTDGRADVWIPDEPGALRRLDLLVTAMDERLAAKFADGL